MSDLFVSIKFLFLTRIQASFFIGMLSPLSSIPRSFYRILFILCSTFLDALSPKTKTKKSEYGELSVTSKSQHVFAVPRLAADVMDTKLQHLNEKATFNPLRPIRMR